MLNIRSTPLSTDVSTRNRASFIRLRVYGSLAPVGVNFPVTGARVQQLLLTLSQWPNLIRAKCPPPSCL
jgi:hypothetical protein